MAEGTGLIPVGAWIRVEAAAGIWVVGFTYVDPRAGFSAQGWHVSGDTLDESARVIVRLSKPELVWRAVYSEEAVRWGLETPPAWVAEFYGPQPLPGALWGAWREHPKLRGRLLKEHPDDLQIVVHDGGPRLSSKAPEAVWVSLLGMEGDVFRARVLNQPFHLTTVKEGSLIRFVVGDADKHPVMVTDRYLEEREDWRIHPCNKCGFAELFDAPSDLMRAVFPNVSGEDRICAFTAICPLCGGAQAVEPMGSADESEDPPGIREGKRPWWRPWG